jgi:hypothetical protein
MGAQEDGMPDDTLLKLPALLGTAKRILATGAAPRKGRPLIAAWSSNPSNSKLESHWVTDPSDPADKEDVVVNGIL